jgi:hypothetical protein
MTSQRNTNLKGIAPYSKPPCNNRFSYLEWKSAAMGLPFQQSIPWRHTSASHHQFIFSAKKTRKSYLGKLKNNLTNSISWQFIDRK